MRMRKEFAAGLLLFGLALTLKQFFAVPEILMGFLLGLSLCFEGIGVLPETAYRKIKGIKGALLRR